MKIWFNDRYHRMRISSETVTRLAEGVLFEMRTPNAEVGVTLVGDPEMRRLNRRYRGINCPTDVLAFAMQEGSPQPCPRQCPRLLGDIVISADTLKKQARRQGHSMRHEISVLIIHGLLHLLGFDHERSPAKARAMRRKEEQLLEIASKLI